MSQIRIMSDAWNRCNVCGQFIAYSDFESGEAKNVLVNPSAYGTEEVWDTYHVRCDSAEGSQKNG